MVTVFSNRVNMCYKPYLMHAIATTTCIVQAGTQTNKTLQFISSKCLKRLVEKHIAIASQQLVI